MPPRGGADCLACEHPLWANRSERWHYYRCSARSRGEECRERDAVRAELIEGRVADLFQSVELPTDWQELAYHLAAEERFLREILSAESAKREVCELEQRLARLAPPDQEIIERGEELLTVPSLWPYMTPDQRARLVRASLDFVTVDVEAGTIGPFAPKPELDPLFRAMAIGDGPLELCVWRPRADSNPA